MTLHDVGQHNRVPVTHRGDHGRKPVTAPQKSTTQTGAVKFYNAAAGHGYIRPDTGGKDVYVHKDHLAESNMPLLVRRQRVEYELNVDNVGRPYARNLRPAPKTD